MPSGRPKEIQANIAKCPDAPCVARTLVDAIQLISKTNNTVGGNCMTIYLPPPQELRTEIEFVPLVEHTAVIKDSATNEVHIGPFPVVYSPWIIGPKLVSPPAVMFGGGQFSLGRWRIDVKAQTVKVDGLHGAWSSQTRPPRPLR